MYHLVILALAWQAAAVPLGEMQVDMNGTESYGEYGPYFQGDIILTEEQQQSLLAKQGLKADSKRWPSKTVPYVLSSSFGADERKSIQDGIRMITSTTCIKIVPRTNQKGYVKVDKGGGCSSVIGYQGGAQAMNLENCSPGSIAHEFMHALGIHHEHVRSDRDNFVTINFQNIQKGAEYNFQKVDPPKDWDNFGTQYDYGSIMHYYDGAFGNGKITIVTKTKGAKIGQREKLSQKDIKMIKTMYKC